MNTDELIAHSRSRFDHAAAKRVLKEKYQAKMTFAHAGGLWQAGPELLILLHTVKENDPVVLLDLYENPVQVIPKELVELTQQRWQEQMTAWLLEYTEINKNR
jgi:hypothetical protein